MPTVSVITPTYNRGNIVAETIKSILTQSYKDFELLVIDDGSADNTRQIISALPDSRIKYIYKQNGGVSSARNLGLKEATGEFIAFLDSDDFWPQDFLATMLDALRKNPDCGLAYCLTSVKSANGEIKNYDSSQRCHSGDITEQLFMNSVIWPSATIFRKSISENIFFDTQLKNAEDSDFFLRMSAKAKYLFVEGIRAIRTASPDSLSNFAGINCARILSLERFYFHLGGDKLVSRNAALKKLAKACRRIAERHRKNNNKKAALYLYKKALRYQPTDVRLYIGFAKAVIMTKDNLPDWQMPKPLSNPLCNLCNQDEQKLT